MRVAKCMRRMRRVVAALGPPSIGLKNTVPTAWAKNNYARPALHPVQALPAYCEPPWHCSRDDSPGSLCTCQQLVLIACLAHENVLITKDKSGQSKNADVAIGMLQCTCTR